MIVETRPVNSIKIGDRVRADLGDLTELIDSLRERGLINPVTIEPDGDLVAGARRLEAAKRLGWSEIDVHVWQQDAADEILAVEIEENTCRAPLTLAEAEQGWQHYRKLITEARQVASSDNTHVPPGGIDQGWQGDLAAKAVGYSGDTMSRVQEVREAVEDEALDEEIREVAKAEYEKLKTSTVGARPAAEAVKAAKKRGEGLREWNEKQRAKTRKAMVPGQTLRSEEPKAPPKRADWTSRLWEAVSKAAGPIPLVSLSEQLAREPIEDVDVKIGDLTRMADLLQEQIRHRQELRKLLLTIKKGRKE